MEVPTRDADGFTGGIPHRSAALKNAEGYL
jgi:hypothetical protein